MIKSFNKKESRVPCKGVLSVKSFSSHLRRRSPLHFELSHHQGLRQVVKLVAGGYRLTPGGLQARCTPLERGRVPVETAVPVLQVLPIVLSQKRVQEGVNAAVAVGQAGDQVVNASLCVRGQLERSVIKTH